MLLITRPISICESTQSLYHKAQKVVDTEAWSKGYTGGIDLYRAVLWLPPKAS